MNSLWPPTAPTGKPPPMIFPKRRQVGIDAPQPLRAAKTQPKGDDLVEDQQRADLARDRAQRLEIRLVGGRKPGAVRHRIDQHAGELRAVLADQADGAASASLNGMATTSASTLSGVPFAYATDTGALRPQASGVGSRLTSA